MKRRNIGRSISKVSVWMAVLAGLGAVVGRATTADAALLVKFDVNYQSGVNPVTPTASGYTSLAVTSTSNTGTATSNGVTATLTSDTTGARNRAPSVTDPLLVDLLFGASPASPLNTTPSMTITFTGLTAGATYKFTVYSADNGVGYTTGDVSAFYQDASATPFLPSVKVVDSTSATPGGASYSALLTPLTGTTLTITVKPVSDSTSPAASVDHQIYTVVNGFELEAVPEPGSLSLLGVCGLWALRRRR